MKTILIKFGWIILLLVGLAFALRGFMPHEISKWITPKEIYAQIDESFNPRLSAPAMIAPDYALEIRPKTEEMKIVPLKDPKGQKREQVFDSPVGAVGATGAAAGSLQKDWTDYVDKIVGWIVALAGAYKLFQKSPQPQPAPAPVPEPTPIPVKKPRKPRKRANPS